jgi:catechol 2,3-dioxygenase-like lactoylglutathione lyase family enzyme
MSQILKVHVALNTERFEESVAFYRAFFGLEPVKLKPGYAKFDVAEPPLNFTLNQGPAPAAGALNHLGIQVAASAAVEQAAARLAAAGLATLEEKGTDCCYALQDKVWVSDPNGYRWEVFVVKVADTRPELTAAAAEAPQCCAASCCAA